MKTTITQTGDGVALTITDDAGNASRWSMQGDQFAKHVRGIDDKDHPFNAVPRGELSAARDMANEATKQLES